MENYPTPEKHSFKLGDVVALSSHPFTSSQHDIIVGGEPQLISPLMIIVEIIGDSQNLYDENVGNQIQRKGGATAQCKCMWYSSKSFQFEEAWLSSKLLKKIKEENTSINNEKDNNGKHIHLEIGKLVTLCTAQLELRKLKNSYKNEGGNERLTINSLLSFVSPMMQIIGTAKNESKEPLFDSKTGNKKKEISELLIKCKWFNPFSEKMSEKLIPIEALILIPEVDENKLKNINTFIKSGEHILVKVKERETIIKPEHIRFTHGFYTLNGYDYISNKIEEFLIDEELVISNISKVFFLKVPDFQDDTLKNKLYEEQVKIVVAIAKKGNNYVRIKYKDRNANVTIRTIKEFDFFVQDNINYLVGYCLLRGAIRHFKINEIQFLGVLNLSSK